MDSNSREFAALCIKTVNRQRFRPPEGSIVGFIRERINPMISITSAALDNADESTTESARRSIARVRVREILDHVVRDTDLKVYMES